MEESREDLNEYKERLSNLESCISELETRSPTSTAVPSDYDTRLHKVETDLSQLLSAKGTSEENIPNISERSINLSEGDNSELLSSPNLSKTTLTNDKIDILSQHQNDVKQLEDVISYISSTSSLSTIPNSTHTRATQRARQAPHDRPGRIVAIYPRSASEAIGPPPELLPFFSLTHPYIA